jgi:hypothetical protein
MKAKVGLSLSRIIVAPPLWSNQKNVSTKSYYLCITNNEIVQNSKSKPKNCHSSVPITLKKKSGKK